ncbi:MAG: response regulator [Chromatiaceae bacterium]|jgi:AmiR/NasT family two-component response regulator|nr:response regulator [Chromatiaceae bacterium]
MSQIKERKTILVADDDPLILTLMSTGLRNAGYEVLEASGGRQAVLLAASNTPDLVVLDIGMPDLSGIEAAKIINTELGLPIVFLSAHDDEETVSAALDQGAMGYLIKPIKAQRMFPTIEAAMRRASDIRRLAGAVESAEKISQATGIVMERFKVDSEEAFERIRRNARSRRIKVAVVSDEIVSAAALINTFASASDQRTKKRSRQRKPDSHTFA